MGKGEQGEQTNTNRSNYLVKPTEASKMLEAALLQMDDILSGGENNESKDPIKDLTDNLVNLLQSTPRPLRPPDANAVMILMEWLQPSCLMGLARMIALHGSLPNICAAASVAQSINNLPFCNTPCSSIPRDFVQRLPKEQHCKFGCTSGQRACNCCLPTYHHHHHGHQLNRTSCDDPHFITDKINDDNNATSSRGNNRCNTIGSVERRRRRFKSKTDRCHQRIKSQSDLSCEKKNKLHYCSLQHFHCPDDKNCTDRTEERLQKLENERSSLHMEIAVLSEQLDTQTSKILDLENALKEKKDALRHMEESLQKEVLLRSALETQKLELLSSLSEMKLRQASLEHENVALRNTNFMTKSERFSRHAGQYSSLPRPPTSMKRGVAFAVEDKTTVIDEKTCPTKPFVQLSIEEIGDWLATLGLESYTNELKRWGATGKKLLESSTNQLEKELDIRNTMHRKKLFYAVESERCNGNGFFGSEKMDNAAVLRWLDDIGLPQHKEAFFNAKIDGRVLHRLTTDDLFVLNITGQLHAASLRQGIQILRELNFEFDNLERRSANNPANANEGSRISLWTNHRVMEWLRVVDLAEYAPNMRGSGVHGGLIVYENRFNAELLASLLNIPPSKSLLRRHLNTHFNEIIGRDVVQQKRQTESAVGFVPLTLTARLKTPKRSQFTLKRKKSKTEIDYVNLVCPLEETPPGTPQSSSTTSPGSSNLNSPTH